MEILPVSGHPVSFMPASLEKRIPELCGKVVATKDFADLAPLLSELRIALQKHFGHIREMVAERARRTLPP